MIVVDVETTGLNPLQNSILSIGALNFENPDQGFYMECQSFDGAIISPDALRINGRAAGTLNDPRWQGEDEIIEQFLWWATQEDTTIAGENPRFDLEFLKAAAERAKIPWGLGFRTVDLHTLTYTHYLKRCIPVPIKSRASAISRDVTLAYVGLPPEHLPHKATRCVAVEAEAFSRLLYGENLLREFAEYPIPRYLR